jgi:hypothetical protein
MRASMSTTGIIKRDWRIAPESWVLSRGTQTSPVPPESLLTKNAIRNPKAVMPIAPLAMAAHPARRYDNTDVVEEGCAVIVGLPSSEYDNKQHLVTCGSWLRPPNN